MRKLKLELEDLDVTTFVTEGEKESRGTAYAHSAIPVSTINAEFCFCPTGPILCTGIEAVCTGVLPCTATCP